MEAEKPARANELYEYFVSLMRERVASVGTGVFGADMEITMKADGPVTIVMDSEILKNKGK
jgi:D-tyrosyl-tRNA(Tyr) deacylase